MQHPEVLPFIVLLSVLFITGIVAVNVWSYKRRSKLTPEERDAEDKAVGEEDVVW